MIPDRLEFTRQWLAEYDPPSEQWVKNELWLNHEIIEPDDVVVKPMWKDFYEDKKTGFLVQDYKIVCLWHCANNDPQSFDTTTRSEK